MLGSEALSTYVCPNMFGHIVFLSLEGDKYKKINLLSYCLLFIVLCITPITPQTHNMGMCAHKSVVGSLLHSDVAFFTLYILLEFPKVINSKIALLPFIINK